MTRHGQLHLALHAALIGMVGLAAATGIGRFAFTPMLPLMQSHGSVTLSQGSYLASANYIGYLVGALLCLASNTRPPRAARFGLAAVAGSTLAMGYTSAYMAWLVLRLIAGGASAFAFVGVSAWALAKLAGYQRSRWSGWVFAGVGVGILFAGIAVLVIGAIGLTPTIGWLLLGVAASLATLFAAGSIKDAPSSRKKLQSPAPNILNATAWRLVICCGTFGFGYIIPATFLPAAARALINDPPVFGWTWPVFGLAAATSTVIAASVLGNLTPRRSWALSQVVMAAGVALPAIHTTLASVMISAVCVGGTFMVITMAGMQEARRVGEEAPPRLMAAMTAAFAAGQLAGPLTVHAAGSAAEAIRAPSLLAAALLFLTALVLMPGVGRCVKPAAEAARVLGLLCR